jgi:uncharacterized YigZ family protein
MAILRQMIDEYTTIAGEAQSELRVTGSRFLACAAHAGSADEAEEMLARARKEYYDATHHCFAYRTGVAGDRFLTGDDHEPSGTAGKPILAAIDHRGLTDVLVVVVRYFGGTKLGVGGLARAYGSAAEHALAAAPSVTRYVTERLRVACPHNHVGGVMHVAGRLGARVVEGAYDTEAHLTLEIRASLVAALREALVDHTNGVITIHA